MSDPEGLREVLLEEVKRRPSSSVRSLVQGFQGRYSDVEVLEAIEGLKDERKLVLSRPPVAFGSFLSYLAAPSWSLRFWLVVLTSGLTLGSVYILPDTLPWVALRWVFGAAFVLFLPGFSFVEMLFPRDADLDSIERLALSVGLSLALVPITGLLLNYTPFGIRLNPIVASIALLTLLFISVGSFRRYWLRRPSE